MAEFQQGEQVILRSKAGEDSIIGTYLGETVHEGIECWEIVSNESDRNVIADKSKWELKHHG